MRHAQADAPPRGGSDRDRPLSDSGRRDAEALARKIGQENWRPGKIICSPARRTRETLTPIEALWPGIALEAPQHLYLASTGDLYELVKRQDDETQSLMLIGHNPGLHGLAQLLCGQGEPAAVMGLMTGFQPGSLAIVEFDAERWYDLMPGGGYLAHLLVGKEFA